MSDSIFDAEKNYYVFKYVVDKVSGEPTEYEGEVMAFVKATDPWSAVDVAGFGGDMNAYGANLVEDMDKFTEAIKEERKHLSKISKQLKEMVDERDGELKKYLEERPCPNGCGQMSEDFTCDTCGYGHELEQLVADLDNKIEEEKAKGNDTTELEKLRDSFAKG